RCALACRSSKCLQHGTPAAAADHRIGCSTISPISGSASLSASAPARRFCCPMRQLRAPIPPRFHSRTPSRSGAPAKRQTTKRSPHAATVEFNEVGGNLGLGGKTDNLVAPGSGRGETAASINQQRRTAEVPKKVRDRLLSGRQQRNIKFFVGCGACGMW